MPRLRSMAPPTCSSGHGTARAKRASRRTSASTNWRSGCWREWASDRTRGWERRATAGPVRGGDVRKRGNWLVLALIVAGALMVAFVAGAPRGEGEPLDPASTGPNGARALVLLLENQGARVDVSDHPPGPGDDVV